MKPETAKLFKKQFGDVFMSAEDVVSRERVIIPTTPKLDIQLSGGIPTGSIVLISGKPSLGKSTLALQICKNAQQEEYGSRECYYIDVEGRLEPEKTILLLHGPAYNTNVDLIEDGMHAGNKTIRKCVDKMKPLCVFSGHIHESEGQQDWIDGTYYLNPGMFGVVIDLKEVQKFRKKNEKFSLNLEKNIF
jgi:GTPase SAR1 family protein